MESMSNTTENSSQKPFNRREGFAKRNWGMIYAVLSLLFDLVFMNAAFLVSLWLRFGHLNDFKYYTKAMVFVNVMFLIVSLGLGVYRSRYNLSRENLRYYYKRLVIYIAVLTMAFLYVIHGQDYSRAVIFTAFFIIYVFFEFSHGLLRKLQNILIGKHIIGFNTLIIGTNEWTYKFSQRISYVFGGFFHVLGYIRNTADMEPGQEPTIYKDLEDHVIGSQEQLDDFLEKYTPDVVFIVSETMEVDKYRSIYEICKNRSIKLKVVSPKVSDIFTNTKIRDVFGVSLVLETWRIHFQRFNNRLKRIFDIAFVLAVSPVLLPLGLFIALMIKLTSRGPVFFKQKRSLYKDGKEFYFYKFRSMRQDAEEMKESLMGQNESNGALFKMKKDPRVTWFGRIIRKFSLDELPQIINVIKGEMAIVGPRPLPYADFGHVENVEMSFDWHSQRGTVKPGITGLWQISGRSDLSFEEMLFLDLYYIEHQSIFFDLEILFETLPTILFGKGAY
jgi:exopolysaccharide biosynthesis polyprenyl glycosylphosphotransferase